MTKYLISFDEGDMTFPDEDLPVVADAAHTVLRQAKDAGVWVFGAGLLNHTDLKLVDTDGTITGPSSESRKYLGGFAIVDVPSIKDALEWGAKFAVACRCAQAVREIMDDPEA